MAYVNDDLGGLFSFPAFRAPKIGALPTTKAPVGGAATSPAAGVVGAGIRLTPAAQQKLEQMHEETKAKVAAIVAARTSPAVAPFGTLTSARIRPPVAPATSPVAAQPTLPAVLGGRMITDRPPAPPAPPAMPLDVPQLPGASTPGVTLVSRPPVVAAEPSNHGIVPPTGPQVETLLPPVAPLTSPAVAPASSGNGKIVAACVVAGGLMLLVRRGRRGGR